MNRKRILKNSLLCAAWSIAGGLAISAISYFLFGASASDNDAVEHYAFYAFIAIFIAPFVETLLFTVVDVLSRRLPQQARLGIAAIAFSLMHFSGGPIKCLLVLWPGLVYAYAYFYLGKSRKESYWTCALSHLINNAVLLATVPIFS